MGCVVAKMKKVVIFLFICGIILCSGGLYLSFKETKKVNSSKIRNNLDQYKFDVLPVTTKKNLNILVLEIDPILTKSVVDGKDCSGLSVNECFNFDKNAAVNELIDDLKYSSYNIINPRIVKTEKINEFPRVKNQFKLSNGTYSNSMDEDTWYSYFKDGWYNGVIKNYDFMGSYSFDYEYYINKYNLVERRNNNEFDEVWISVIDPSRDYESIMVGRAAYWINGAEIVKNCENFKIMNVSPSRRDANFECNGHAAENILSNVFNYRLVYEEGKMSVSSSNYVSLNLWQKFTLTEHNNVNKNTDLSGPGNVHYSPNSVCDYDWENYGNNNVKSKWREWLNYPNLTSNPSMETFTPDAYMKNSISGYQSAARLHHRWWFRLMPHINGYTTDGYLNNWWEYLLTTDYVTSVNVLESVYEYNVGDSINNIKFKIKYHNGKNIEETLSKYTANMIFDDKNILRVDDDGVIIAYSKGETNLKYYRDGKYATVTIKIK